MLVMFLYLFFLFPTLLAQSFGTHSSSTSVVVRALDALLQEYACRAFVRPKTGVPYNAIIPSNLTGIQECSSPSYFSCRFTREKLKSE
ncbi:hypothetical protein V6N13_107030 [Hibiscus sabdariffa]|uniref:Secreted protein n=1 Tax=Hibiscus sabdariffa TaxID=183260 RepID=A0ABR2F2K1_9ROSI